MSKNHSWTETDDLAALYLYLYKTEHLSYTYDEIAEMKGIKPASMKMRILNFQALDTGDGLSNFARQSERVFDAYNSLPEPELCKLAFPELFAKKIDDND